MAEQPQSSQAQQRQSEQERERAAAQQQQAVEAQRAVASQGKSPLSPTGAARVPEEGSSSIKPPILTAGVAAMYEQPTSAVARANLLPEAARADAGSADEREAARSNRANDVGESPEGLAAEAETVWVESGLPNTRTALYERDPSHPGGEAFVGPGEAVEVARTGSVEARLQAGVLREASGETRRATEQRQARAEESRREQK